MGRCGAGIMYARVIMDFKKISNTWEWMRKVVEEEEEKYVTLVYEKKGYTLLHFCGYCKLEKANQ